MQKHIKKFLAALFLSFVVLFAVRFILSFYIEFDGVVRFEGENKTRTSEVQLRSQSPSPSPPPFIPYEKAVSSNVSVSGNITSGASISFKDGSTIVGQINQIEVYAKEARLNSSTKHFENDSEQLLKILENTDSIIRIENRGGMKPYRFLRLVLKVVDSNFDKTVSELKDIGDLSSIDISKEDKSEEVKKLYAQKQSLENYKQSLANLRSQEGKVVLRKLLWEHI